jgi:hypothetical protein
VGEIEISERSAGVRAVRLNRPDRLNALTPDSAEIMLTNRHCPGRSGTSGGQAIRS